MHVIDDRRTLTVEETARMLGISRSLAYEEARKGAIVGIPVLRIGARFVIPRAAVERVLNAEVRDDG